MSEIDRKAKKPRKPRTPGEVEERIEELKVAEATPRFRRESAKTHSAAVPAQEVVEKLNAEIEALASEVSEVQQPKEEDIMNDANKTATEEVIDAKLQQASKWSWGKIAIATGLGILCASTMYRGYVNSREIKALKALNQQ